MNFRTTKRARWVAKLVFLFVFSAVILLKPGVAFGLAVNQCMGLSCNAIFNQLTGMCSGQD